MPTDSLIKLIKNFEGCRLKAYKDIAGVWTIGYGHTGIDVTPTSIITQDEADKLLINDLMDAEKAVLLFLHVQLKETQLNALISFTFNLGAGSLQHSSLLRYVNLGQFKRAGDEFEKWCHAGGKPSASLLARRRAERDLFLSI